MEESGRVRHDIELVKISMGLWEVLDHTAESEVIGRLQHDGASYEALITDRRAWNPHFDSLDAARTYFEEYLFALELGAK